MGIWKEIKYALNSTLGTNYFMPLNEMVNRELTTSDDVYFLSNEKYEKTTSLTGGESFEDTYDFKDMLVRCNGSCYLNFVGNFPVTVRLVKIVNYDIGIIVNHKDGTQTSYTATVPNPDNVNKDAVETNKILIPLKQGDVIGFKLHYTLRNVDMYPHDYNISAAIKIYAKEVPFSLLKVEE